MTTAISPSLGHGVPFTQGGTGTSPGYSAIDVRRSDAVGLQEGVVEGGAYMVTQRSAGGANMSVDIAASAGSAVVQGDAVSFQSLYTIPPHSAVINEALTAADPTNPRIDQVILEVKDDTHDGSGSNLAQTRVLTGTPTAGATLANRNGAAALPGSALRLADVLVGASVASVDNTKIRDRRGWARGAFLAIVRNQNAAAGNNYTTSSASATLIDGTNLQPRVECSGVPLRVSLRGEIGHTVATDRIRFSLMVDGVAVPTVVPEIAWRAQAASNEDGMAWEVTHPSISAGSHLIGVAWRTDAATAQLIASASLVCEMTVEEIVRQNTANNTVTTG